MVPRAERHRLREALRGVTYVLLLAVAVGGVAAAIAIVSVLVVG